MKAFALRQVSAMVIAMGAAVVGNASLSPLSASAASTDESSGEVRYAAFRAGLTSLNVAAPVRNELVKTLESGKPIDSLLSTAIPTSTETFVQNGDAVYAAHGSTVTVQRFGDGSVKVTAREAAQEIDPTDRSIQGCTVSSGSGYQSFTGCTISGWWGTVQIAFVASYTLVNGGPDYISASGTTWQQCVFPTTCTSPHYSIKKWNEDVNGPAVLRGTSDVTASWGSWQVWMQLNVGGDSGWDTSS